MDKHELQMLRAEQAQQLKANPVFDQAFSDTRRGIMETWAQLDTSDTDTARDLHRMLKCLDRVRKCIDVHIDTGKLARHEIEARAKFSVLDRINPLRRTG